MRGQSVLPQGSIPEVSVYIFVKGLSEVVQNSSKTYIVYQKSYYKIQKSKQRLAKFCEYLCSPYNSTMFTKLAL